MQRIVRSPSLYSAVSSAAHSQSETLFHVCPEHLSSLFASSRKGGDGQLEWWSPLGGQAIPFAQLSVLQQKTLLKVLEQRKVSFEYRAKELEQTGQSNAAQTLRTLMSKTDFSRLYSIDNMPVVVEWQETIKKEVVTSAPIIPIAADKAAVAKVVGASKVKVIKMTPILYIYRDRKLWLLLLMLLLLIGFALLLWWQLFYKDVSFLDALKLASESNGRVESYACAKNKTNVTPDFVTVFDTSGSMKLNMGASLADEEWLMSISGLYDDKNREPRRLSVLSSPTREEIAKQAYTNMLSSLHADIETRLITFNGCNEVIDHGLYNGKQRGQLIAKLAQTNAADGTPLAESLRVAASKVDGVNKDAMIILFIDGEDGCGKDVCALAGELSTKKPRLQINVVDVSGNDLSGCAARLTKGRIYSSQDVGQVSELFIQAAEQFSYKQCE